MKIKRFIEKLEKNMNIYSKWWLHLPKENGVFSKTGITVFLCKPHLGLGALNDPDYYYSSPGRPDPVPLSVVDPGSVVHHSPLAVPEVEGEDEGAVDGGQRQVVGGGQAGVAPAPRGVAAPRPQDQPVGGD